MRLSRRPPPVLPRATRGGGARSARLVVLLSLILLRGSAFALPAPESLPAALVAVPGADLVFFDEARAGEQARVLAVARTKAPAAKLRAVMLDPQAYRRAVPSFRKVEVLARQGADVQVGWELEVPLWNLAGKLWLRPTADGVDIDLAEGDLAPGRFRLRARPLPDGVVLSVEAAANMREANWATRRLAKRSPLAEPAMTATTAWLLLRALVLEAERRDTAVDPRRQPQATMAPPALAAIDGTALGRLARDRLTAGQALAAVRSAPTGRLDRVEVATPSKLAPPALARGLADPARWRALPGWHAVKPQAAHPWVWEVDSRFPFVDFDATWAIQAGPPLRGQAIGGNARGAVLGWDLLPVASGTMAVFSLHPRLETSGYIPRKFIQAEPLLEQGLSLGLAYVDALSLMRSQP
jgi:hypothetical protein